MKYKVYEAFLCVPNIRQKRPETPHHDTQPPPFTLRMGVNGHLSCELIYLFCLVYGHVHV